MKGPVKTIVFDAVGTLLRPVESISAVYQRTAASHGLELERETVKHRFATARQQIFSNDTDQPSSDDLEKSRWKTLVASVFRELPDPSGLFQDLWDYYANPGHWMVFPEVPDCLEQLTERELSIAIASNFDSRLLHICRETTPLDQIRLVFCSGRIGYCKPDPRFYETVEQRIRTEVPEHANARPMMIGDDLEKDVLAARSIGWTALHLDRPRRDLCSVLRQAFD